MSHGNSFALDWWDRLAALDACESYVVLVVDPQTQEADAHGPYGGMDALRVADQIRRDVESDGLHDIEVSVTRLHLPGADEPGSVLS